MNPSKWISEMGSHWFRQRRPGMLCYASISNNFHYILHLNLSLSQLISGMGPHFLCPRITGLLRTCWRIITELWNELKAKRFCRNGSHNTKDKDVCWRYKVELKTIRQSKNKWNEQSLVEIEFIESDIKLYLFRWKMELKTYKKILS